MSLITPDSQGNSNSTKTFLTALVANGGLLIVEVGTFLLLKQRLWRIYSPRTYLPPPEKRAQELPSGPWKWLPALFMSSTEDIIHKNGLDAYMFLRFLKMLIWIFFAFTLLTFAVIIPIDAVNITTSSGLERISWTNIVDPTDQLRFSAHVVVVYLLTFLVLYMMYREMAHFVDVRHQFLISKSHSRLAQARTVLITSVPDELANEHDLRTFASFVPGGVDRVWIYRDTRVLNELFEERQKACMKLEAAEAQVLWHATKAWRYREAASRKGRKVKPKDEERHEIENDKLIVPLASRELLDELVPPTNWPRHRTGFLGLFGPKVDTIEWYKTEIARLNNSIKEGRENVGDGKFLGSAFIRCNLQMGAHVLAQCVSYHKPLMMYAKWMEANPKDIVWRNLDDGALEMRTRFFLSWVATIGLIVAWAFPVAFIGSLSNLDDLCGKLSWLRWVCTAPNPVPGIIQGVLPPAFLAILFAFLPFILRGLAWYQCIPRYSLISVSVYRRFFFFLLVHGFLIVTLSSGITKAIQGIIEQPTQTVQQLASHLPGASIFFLTYMITQGLAGAGSALAQLVPLILHFIRKRFLGRTPRQAYGVTFLMPSADFGIILPRLSLLAAITFAYSVLTPLINLLALISFAMFYIAWKLLLTQVFDQPDQMETGGLYFPMAISNLFVGLYIEQICLACLFFLNTTVARTSSIVEGVLMLVLVVITVIAQLFIKNSFDPITEYLPMSLATKKMAKRYEKQRKNRVGFTGSEEEIDLFSRNTMRSVRRRVKTTVKILDNQIDSLKAKVTGAEDPQAKKAKKSGKQKKEPTKIDEEGSDHDAGLANISVAHTSEGAPELYRHSSTASKESKASKKSKVSVKDLPDIAPAAPAGISLSDDDSSDEEDDFDEHAFDHPSTYVDQPWIWLPRDKLGFSDLLRNELKAVGVDASDVGATMDEKGIVEVTRNPPDEDWSGGHDR